MPFFPGLCNFLCIGLFKVIDRGKVKDSYLWVWELGISHDFLTRNILITEKSCACPKTKYSFMPLKRKAIVAKINMILFFFLFTVSFSICLQMQVFFIPLPKLKRYQAFVVVGGAGLWPLGLVRMRLGCTIFTWLGWHFLALTIQ